MSLRPDETPSRGGFSPQAVFWRPCARVCAGWKFCPLRPARSKPAQEFVKFCLLSTRTRRLPARTRPAHLPSTHPPHPHCFCPNFPSLHLSLSVWKLLKTHSMFFIDGDNWFIGSLQRERKLLKKKHCKLKMLNLSDNLERFFLSFKSTIQEEYVVHWRTL